MRKNEMPRIYALMRDSRVNFFLNNLRKGKYNTARQLAGKARIAKRKKKDGRS